jgi:hypothetical protein
MCTDSHLAPTYFCPITSSTHGHCSAVCLPLLGTTRGRQGPPGVRQVAKMQPANCRRPNNPDHQVLRSILDMPRSTPDVHRSPDDNQMTARLWPDVTGYQMTARSRPDRFPLTRLLPFCRRQHVPVRWTLLPQLIGRFSLGSKVFPGDGTACANAWLLFDQISVNGSATLKFNIKNSVFRLWGLGY